MNKITPYCRKVDLECRFCKNRPTKLITIQIAHIFAATEVFEQFVCSEHEDKAIAQAFGWR